MRKIAGFVLSVIFASTPLFAYQHNLPNLRTASTLSKHQVVIDVDHRFGGAVDHDPINTALGLSEGASVGLMARYGLSETTHGEIVGGLKLHDATSESELEIGYSQDLLYVLDIPARLQGQITYFTVKNLNESSRDGNLYYLLALQPKKPFLEKWTPVLNLGYDGFSTGSTVGAGVEYAINDSWFVVGEVIEPNTKGRDTVWVLGVKMQTFGHNFMLMLQNSPDVGLRTLAKGTVEKDVYFGFKLQRLVDLDGVWGPKNEK